MDEDELSSHERYDRLASWVLANGAVIIGHDGSQSFDLDPKPKPFTVDEWAAAMAQREAYWARQRVVWGRIRRGLFLAGCTFAGLLLVLAVHHGA